ncbi:MAG: V-type ATPase 116kDa subunit family protein [Candidatus Caldarchaeales archaeon]
MGLRDLLRVTLIVPEHRLTEVIKELYSFEWFHVEEKDYGLDEKIRRSYDVLKKLGTELDALISSLNISVEDGIINQLIRGYRIRKEKLEINEVEELIMKIEREAQPIIQEARESLEKARRLREELKQVETLISSLRLLRDFDIDPEKLRRLKRFYAVFTVVERRSIEEIKRSIPTSSIIDVPLEKNLTALLIISLREDEERVDRVLRGFGVKPFTIPSDLPQSINEAYNVLVARREEVEEELGRAEGNIMKIRSQLGDKIVALREGVQVAEDVLHKLGGSGGLKRFRIINGYVPKDLVEKFRSEFGGRYGVFFEEIGGGGHEAPTLLNNKGIIKSFENITSIQGFPRSDEIDPTPYVALFFSIFYGIMFADLGQGLILALFGLFMFKRVEGNLREWAKLLTILGVSSAIGGFIIGEAFGFKVHFPFPKPELIHLVEKHDGATRFNMDDVLKLIQFTLFLGTIHLTIGYILSFRKTLKHREYVEAFAAKLPTITMYIFGILFAFCFFGAGGDLGSILSSDNLVPYIGVPTRVLAPIVIGGAALSISILVLGRPIIEGFVKKKREEFIPLMGGGLLELLENIIHFMSNTLSYVRLTVLLLVHTALLMLLNASWSMLGWNSLPILVIGNLGIMALEGLMVFIQALRLHLYEFFTKFYQGEGIPFRKIKPETRHVEILFKR